MTDATNHNAKKDQVRWAIARLTAALKYGPDMESSLDQCIDDAAHFLKQALARKKAD